MSFETLHTDTYAILEKDPFLSRMQVEIILEDLGDVETAISAAIAKMGVCAIVSTPSAKAQSEASRNIVAQARICVQVMELPVTNRGVANTCSAGTAARRIATALNLQKTAGGECLVFDEIESAALEKGYVVYNVWLKALTNLTLTEKEE